MWCPWHIIINCPHRPRSQVNQVATIDKLESNSLGISNNLGDPRFSKSLSQLDDELND